ncbi:MAG: hypothetical protein CMH90_02265 [Oceanicaulis sp.]|uniref:DUF1254 domain-containing protein n=1 Tax=Oceanicaulis sp. UBA2681 TaxID=1947007 RepID=UPI000C09D958|nr:DUF1254 domain-containing protein [Oceanicaulis sp. UBA2681]MAP48282.1 hypothetical protein [Oceanicaulis sp.]HCR67429.1 hypothetical protein [Oceanicaulis sp.]|tara:strand:- start:2261 stop:3637 length:1377 start_codon:yes stop_codon:yes gene_type:complete
MRQIIVLAGLVIVMGLITIGAWPKLTKNPEELDLRALGERSGHAYIYGYPLVLSDVTRQAFLARAETPALNTLYHRRTRPTHEDRTVVRPNLDTLYTLAFLDLSEGPVLLSTPDFGERDWMFQVLDAWTDVAGAPSRRLNGPGPHDVLILGPDQPRPDDSGMAMMTVSTRTAWLIGRIAIAPGEDLAPIHALQDAVRLTGATPLSRPAAIGGLPPEYVNALSADAFFTRMAGVVSFSDPEALGALTPLGYGPQREDEPAKLGLLARGAMNRGVSVARTQLAQGVNTRPYGPTNWRTLREGVGEYGEDYALRAGVALVGLGANRAEDAIYPNTDIDREGTPLTGDHAYKIRFSPDQTPPVDAFWSVTVYDAQGYLMDTSSGRYTIHSQSDLQRDADGGLTLTFSAEPPPSRQSNWLPVRAGEPFAITARLYSPQPEALSGAWEMPPVEQLSEYVTPPPR